MKMRGTTETVYLDKELHEEVLGDMRENENLRATLQRLIREALDKNGSKKTTG